MKIIFDRIIAKLEDIAEKTDDGLVVDLHDAIDVVYEVKNNHKNQFVSIGCLEQFKWERDIAIEQLEKLGLGFGQKIDGVYFRKEEYNKLLEYKHMYEDLCK